MLRANLWKVILSAVVVLWAAFSLIPLKDHPNFGEFVGNRPYEWRTPPLWGLADSGPYLHDGRAPTVEKAIELHGGQAATSVRKFRELSEADRRALLTFLSTMIAPEASHLKRPRERAELPAVLQPGGRAAGEPRLARTQ